MRKPNSAATEIATVGKMQDLRAAGWSVSRKTQALVGRLTQSITARSTDQHTTNPTEEMMGLLNRKNSKIDAIGKDAPPAAFEKAHICVNGPAITLELKSVKTESHYGDYVYGSGLGERRKITVPATRFKGSLDEAREYAAALNTAIIDASRLEGAVASIYPKN